MFTAYVAIIKLYHTMLLSIKLVECSIALWVIIIHSLVVLVCSLICLLQIVATIVDVNLVLHLCCDIQYIKMVRFACPSITTINTPISTAN